MQIKHLPGRSQTKGREKMLSKPKYGWTDFQLEGTSSYSLSYLDDIPLEWLDQAICGLKQMRPFCVKGFLEPRRFLCLVSYWNCHILVEEDGREPLGETDITSECSHTSMLTFCRLLHRDISSHIDEWADFECRADEDDGCLEKKKLLTKKLKVLEKLIEEREDSFGENRCFL